MFTCDDLWLGGTLTAAGITGATSINSTALAVRDWSSLLGSAGISSRVQVVNGRPGGFVSGDLLGRERYPTLNMEVTRWNGTAVGALTEPTESRQKVVNTDLFLGLITNPAGQYLELDLPDGTSRFIHVRNLDPAPIIQPAKTRTIRVPLVSTYPYWKAGGQESTDTITGVDTMVVGGNREVYDATLVFAGNGTFTHSGLGWSIQVTGASGAVTVNLGTRTVTEGGADALNRIRRSHRNWGWFTVGNNSVTANVSVVLTWRSSYA